MLFTVISCSSESLVVSNICAWTETSLVTLGVAGVRSKITIGLASYNTRGFDCFDANHRGYRSLIFCLKCDATKQSPSSHNGHRSRVFHPDSV